MVNILKYCVNEKKIPIIFSSDIIHCDAMPEAILAGFLVVNFDFETLRFTARCFGESLSLKIKTTEDDQEIIENFLNNKFHSAAIKEPTPEVINSRI